MSATLYLAFSEQDTVDTLILPYLHKEYGFPRPESLDYQAQHNLAISGGGKGRYDGLYLSGGYPYVVLEAKKYAHALNDADFEQAREYATSDFFDKPVPFIVVSNGHEHRFFKKSTTISPKDSKPEYSPIPGTDWKHICAESPGEVRQLLTEAQLLDTLKTFKQKAFNDIEALFLEPVSGKFDLGRHPLGENLDRIVASRRNFSGETTTSSDPAKKRQQSIRQAIDAIALHFTIKILFIKLIEDLSRGADSPRIIHSLFPQSDYDQIGGLFGYKVLNSLSGRDASSALRIFSKSKSFYKKMARSLAKVNWQDIFRYGFSVHTTQYGQLFKARDYDKFLPEEDTLAEIQQRLITIDIRTAVIYGSAAKRSHVIGDIYERLIDDELRSGLGAIYTPDETMRFMVDLGERFLGGFRGKKIVEPACGSGHFYREIYRRYVDQVYEQADKAHQPRNASAAHIEALGHIYGRDIDPFAVQLTLLSTFLEQLKDNLKPGEGSKRLWLADRSIDTQNSLDPITVSPSEYFDIEKTDDLAAARHRLASCLRSTEPDLIIGNPPYGVSVIEGAHYKDIYALQSKDSYGYFIVNALKRLRENGRVIFVLSSSFLTIGSHKKLRQYILANSKIIRVLKLHRATFPGIDVFPVIVELEKCSDKAARAENIYQFYDLSRFHPSTSKPELAAAYKHVLDDSNASAPWPFDPTIAMRYTVRQGVLEAFRGVPIFEGRRSLYEFMADPNALAPEISLKRFDGSVLNVRGTSVRSRIFVKLADPDFPSIASVKIGLQSGNNSKFYRVAPGIKGGAAKGGYKEAPLKQVVSPGELSKLSDAQKADGIEVDDPSNDRFYVPLDKAPAADIEGGLLGMFYRPVDFYVDWSTKSVAEMKSLSGAVFRNPQHYFKLGITYSSTGIYSPTFRLSHGGVFDQKSSNVFCDVMEREVLLGILSATVVKYFAKSFINHGVDTQLGELPIPLPTEEEAEKIRDVVSHIVKCQTDDPAYDYRDQLRELDVIVNAIYALTPEEEEELKTWYVRHYPNLFASAETSEEGELTH